MSDACDLGVDASDPSGSVTVSEDWEAFTCGSCSEVKARMHEELFTHLPARFSEGCVVDEDCTLVRVELACLGSCPIAVPKTRTGELTEALGQLEANACPSIQACPEYADCPFASAKCIGTRCWQRPDRDAGQP